MFEETVVSGAGVEKRVVASTKAELDAAVSAVKKETNPVAIDINVPVAKGHDLVDVDETGQTVGLRNGAGAHNSPLDAVNEDGSRNGDPSVPVAGLDDEKATDKPAKADKKANK